MNSSVCQTRQMSGFGWFSVLYIRKNFPLKFVEIIGNKLIKRSLQNRELENIFERTFSW